MWTRVCAAMAAALCFTVSPAGAQPGELDRLLQQTLQGSRVPAMGAVEIVDGKVAQLSVQGLRRNDGHDAVQPEDPWLIGSDGKPMTAALVARLVDRGLLAWDTPLEQLLPELKAGMHPGYRKVTLQQLLSHLAGLPENVSDMKFFNRFYADTRLLPQQRLAYVARALRDKPVAPAGTAVHYSNTGFMLAGVIAERVTGTPYETLMRTEVFEPLGMSSVGYGPTHAGQPTGHIKGKPVRRAQDSNPLMFAPAGNLHLNLGDWARFCVDQLAGGRGEGQLLSAASYRLMQSTPPGGKGSVGWGVQASLAGREGPVLVHGGSDGNWFALVTLFPSRGRGALVVANAGPDVGADQAVQTVLMALLPKPAEH